MKRVQQFAVFMGLVFVPAYGVTAPRIGLDPVKEVEMVSASPGKPLQFSVRAGLGFFTGELNEYVYLPELAMHRLSALTWDIDRLMMGKLGASIQYKKWLTLTVDSWWKLPDGEGTLNDYDWIIAGEDWTHWSRSNTDISSASILDASANVEFFQRHNYALHGILGFKRDSFEMVAKGGKFIYSEDDFRDTTGSFPSVPVLTYEQTMTSPYIGFGFSAAFTDNIALSGRAIYSPFVDGKATDQHHLRNLVIKDEASGGDMFAFDFSVKWAFQQNLAWDISAGYQKYKTIIGDSTNLFSNSGEVVKQENGVGMNQEMIRFSSSLTYTF